MKRIAVAAALAAAALGSSACATFYGCLELPEAHKRAHYAKVCLSELVEEERGYRLSHDHYTDDLDELIASGLAPEAQHSDLEACLDYPRGIEITIAPDGDSYTIVGYALGDTHLKGKRIVLHGP